MSSDAIVILKADHKEIRGLFRKFQAAGDKAAKTKRRLAGQMIELFTVHTYIENEVMYPEVCALLPDLKDDVLESYEEHHVADVLCTELAGIPPGVLPSVWSSRAGSSQTSGSVVRPPAPMAARNLFSHGIRPPKPSPAMPYLV
jgi:hypothetical protein